MIDPYVTQRAQEALKELLEVEWSSDRIDAAFQQLVFVTSEHFTKTCPVDVQDALSKLEACRDKSPTNKAHALYIAIQVIFMAVGKQDVTLVLKDMSHDLGRTAGNQQRN